MESTEMFYSDVRGIYPCAISAIKWINLCQLLTWQHWMFQCWAAGHYGVHQIQHFKKAVVTLHHTDSNAKEVAISEISIWVCTSVKYKIMTTMMLLIILHMFHILIFDLVEFQRQGWTLLTMRWMRRCWPSRKKGLCMSQRHMCGSRVWPRKWQAENQPLLCNYHQPAQQVTSISL